MKKMIHTAFLVLTAVALTAAITGCQKEDTATPKPPAAPKDHPAH
jgi:hypothetical protein